MMNEQIRALIALQQIDTEIRRLKEKRARMPKLLEKLHDTLRSALATVEEAQRDLERLLQDKRAKERDLEIAADHLRKLKDRTREIKTNKEYLAHLAEIEAAQSSQKTVEDDLLGLMEALEEATAAVAGVKRRFAEEELLLHREEANIREASAQIEETLRQQEAGRNSAALQVDPGTLSLYEKLLQRGGGVAVVAIERGSCVGCHMSLPPQSVNAVREGDRVLTCPQCHRILYWPQEN